MKIFKAIFLFTILINFSFSAFGAEDIQDRFARLRQEELDAKQRRADEVANRITVMQKQLEEERKETVSSQERIWKEFTASLEVERKGLKDQIDAIDERNHLFESEMEKKRQQDNLRLTDRESEIKRMMAEVSRLKSELVEDQKMLERRVQEMRAIPKPAQTTDEKLASAPTQDLQNNKIKITGVKGGEIMGSEPFSARAIEQQYYIEMGDIIELDVWRVPDLTRTVTVRPDGRISLPLVGDMEVVGMSLVELREHLTKKYSEYILNPQISISVRQFGGRKFIILGEVGGPGVYRYQQDISLIEGIALAGGFTEKAKKGKVMIIRGDVKKHPQVKMISANVENLLKKGMLTENLTIMPNDIIYVGKDLLTDYNDIIQNLIQPTMNTAVDYYVVKSARREDRRAEAVFL